MNLVRTIDEEVVRERVRAVVSDMAPVAVEPLSGDLSIAVDLGYDSLGFIEMLVAVEEEVGLPADVEIDGDGVETVADLENELIAAMRTAAAEEVDEGA